MRISRAPNAPSALVGRDRELDIVRERLADATGGHGGLMLIGGEAGIGKTALAEALCREAESQGALVLVGHCYDLTETPPYGPWVELFGRYRPTDGDPSLPAAFTERGTVGAVASQTALFRQVEDFLAALATSRPEGTRPVVLLLDDLHWADPASLDLLRSLARALATLPLLLVTTYRSDELTRRHPLAQLLPLLVREAGAARLDLRPLGERDLRELITARYPVGAADATRLIAYLHGRTEGNPFFVGELLRTLEEEGTLRAIDGGWALEGLTRVRVPPLLRQVIDGRLARLGEEAQALLGVAAVVGQEVPLALWSAATDTGDDALLPVVERAGEARLLSEAPDGTRVRFAHALIREALYEGISPARRRPLHRRIAELLAGQPRPDPDAVAYHFSESGDIRAVAWLVKAGERAQLAYAWLTAIERYEAALSLMETRDSDLGERGWLRYRIARLRRYSTPEQSIEYLDEALHIANSVGDAALAAAARYSRGLCLFYVGTGDDALADMATGCDALEALPLGEQGRLDIEPDTSGMPVIANPRGMLVAALAVAGRLAEAIAMGEATHEGMPRHTPLGELGWAHYGDRQVGLASAYALAGRPDAARAAFDEAAAMFRHTGNHSTLASALSLELLLVSLPYFTDRPDDRTRLAETAAQARRRASTTSETHDRLTHVPVLALAGRWVETEAEAEATLRARWQRALRGLPLIATGEIARARGEREEAWARVREALPGGTDAPHRNAPLWIALPAMRLGATAGLDANDLGTANTWLAAHDRWLASSGTVLGRSEGQALWAQYYRQSLDMEQARAHAERALSHASEPRQPLALLAAHRLLGELDTEARHFDDAASHLEASLALANACEAPYERALTALAMAALRLAVADTEGARTLLDEARATCTPLGAKPALARADALAARLDAARESAPAYPAGLSAREVEVLRLVAQGMTNPQVAERLFLSPRTVEQHLRSVYNKLGVSTRAAATHFAVTNGLA